MVKALGTFGRSRRLLFGFSPWLLVGVSLVLALAVAALSLRNSQREREHITRNFLDRGNALIWALESGARTGMGFRAEHRFLQPLVVETAKQSGIAYIAVVDADGLAIAHSNADEVGQVRPGLPPGHEPPEHIAWRVVERQGDSVFEVFREFSPLQGAGHGGGHGPGGPHGGGRPHGRGMSGGHGHGWKGASAPFALVRMESRKTDSFAIIGFEHKPLREALADDFFNNVLSAVAVSALGLGCFISLFWGHSYSRSRRQLKDTQALASEVVTNLPLGLITGSPAGTVGMSNDMARKMLRADNESLRNAALRELPGLPWATLLAALDKGEKILEKEMELQRGEEKTSISLSASRMSNDEGLFLGYLFILRDIEDVKRLQAELQRNEKLSALGTMAAGVAHEIRNPLSSIKGLATYISRKIPQGGKEEEAAKTMVAEVNRLNRVVSELLEFARPDGAGQSEKDLRDVVRHTLRLAESDIRLKNIAVSVSDEGDIPKVHINAERVTQALLNVFLNAVQAMPSGGSMRVCLRTDAEKNMVAVSVTDTGIGMSKDVLASIFTPYYTTKPSGTGLGLAIAHQVMEGHGGSIRVKSAPGGGSTFTLAFPAIRP